MPQRVCVIRRRTEIIPETASRTSGCETVPVSDPVTVFLLDDHEIVRRGVRDLLEAEPDMSVVGEAGTEEEALRRIPALDPDVAVLDVRLGSGDGISVCREIRTHHPRTKCLMLTSFSDDEALFQAIMAGASGYLLKQILGQDLVTAVRTVAAGGFGGPAHPVEHGRGRRWVEQ